ncbi:MAG: serine protease, partial [Pseudomonadota bacterium]
SFVARLTSWDGRDYDARIVRVMPKRELALLKSAPIAGGRSVRFADSAKLSKGDFALAIGTPNRRMGVATLGRIRLPNIGERLDYGPWGFDNGIEISMEVGNGHSGGPVIDAKGGLIGIVAGYELGDTTKTPYVSPRITYVVPSNGIAAFLRAAGTR